MDPNTNLEEQHRIAARILALFDEHDEDHAILAAVGVSDLVRLAELVQALDGWLSKGAEGRER